MGKASRAKELARASRSPGHPAVTSAVERLEAALVDLEAVAPGWQAEMDLLRASRGQGNTDDWPEWCLVPGEAPYAIATANGLVNSEVINMAPVDQLAAFYAWLQGKNIWQVDPDMASALLRTDMDVEIPIGVLYYLPMWGPYILAPVGCSDWPAGVLGMIVHLDWGMENGLPILRLLVDYGGNRWDSVPLIMSARSIAGMLADTITTAREVGDRLGVDSLEDTLSDKTKVITAAIAIALYSTAVPSNEILLTPHGLMQRWRAPVPLAAISLVVWKSATGLARRYAGLGRCE
jgi:hypothetical protein